MILEKKEEVKEGRNGGESPLSCREGEKGRRDRVPRQPVCSGDREVVWSALALELMIQWLNKCIRLTD